MRKNIAKITLLTSSLLLSGTMVLAVCLLSKVEENSKVNAYEEHTIVLDSDSTTITSSSGSFDAKINDNGAVVKFSYEGASSSGGNLMTLSDGGRLYNPYETSYTYHNRISGLTSVNVVFTGDLRLDYTWGESLLGLNPYYQRRDYTLTSDTSFNFFNEYPNFVRFIANGSVTIQSVTLKFTCESIGEEGTENLSISTTDELKTIRNFVNKGSSFIDQTIELNDDIYVGSFGNSIGNTEAKPFKGTFDGKNHYISGYTKTSTSAAIGFFSNVVGGTIKNLKMSRVFLSSTKERVAGVVSKLVGGTVENVQVLSGTIKGSTDCGGIVGIITNGEDSTIKDCVNWADVVSTGASNGCLGGILGSTASSTTSNILIQNCINYGTINGLATTTNGVCGGIVGITRAKTTGSLDIQNCTNFGDIKSAKPINGGIVGWCRVGTISNCYQDVNAKFYYPNAETVVGEVSETGSSASYLGLFIGQKSGGTLSGQATTMGIASKEDLIAFRNTVNGGDNFSGKIVALKKNIILDGSIGDAIGNTDAKAFKGTFDGNEKSITGFTRTNGTNAAALFSRVTDGVIKNLRMANVTVTTSGNRAAAVVARLYNGTIENVHVLSGTITTGGSETGAICDVVVSGGTISNCVNYANVVAANAEKIGGIVGFVYSGSLTISNCKNYGNVTANNTVADKNGVGGIIGCNSSNKTIIINNCVNYGNVQGYNYVGGIIGIGREDSTGNSSITDCKNYGNISCVATSMGGIAGLTRFNITDCENESNVTLTKGSDTYIAKNLSVYGETVTGTEGGDAVGYIAGTVGNSASAAGSLFNKTISSFEESVANAYTSTSQAYGRIQKMNNSHNILTLANRFSLSEESNYDTFVSLSNRDTSVENAGFGYDYIPNHPEEDAYKLWLANMEPLQLDNGRLFIFYRTDPKETTTAGVFYSSIRAIESRDNGETWLPNHHIIFENYSTDYYGDGIQRGAYEPFAVQDGDTLQVFIAFDAADSQAGGLGPDHSDFTCILWRQNLLRIPVDISNNGFVVGNVAMAMEGTASYRRPGMPSIVKLNDGSYAMIIEHSGSDADYKNYGMRIAISYSHDLISWTTPKIVIQPSHSGNFVVQGGVTYKYLCGAPYIQILSDGRIVVSYSTNDFFEYDGYSLEYGAADYFKTVELAISENPVSYGDTPNMIDQHPIAYEVNHGARYGGCAVIDDQIILIANEYKFVYDGDVTVSRVVARGTVFSTAFLK